MKTYDILNAGPNNRFMADQRIVSNSGWLFNPQNLPRIGPKPRLTDALRNCMRAPKGYKVVVSDLSGIELRVNMFLWKVPYAMELFTNDPEKADLYRYFAANNLYHIPEVEITKAQRQIGKISHLGLGFAAGPGTFIRIAKTMGGIDMEVEEATETVRAYRDAHSEITSGWQICGKRIQDIYEGVEVAIDPWGMCTTNEHGIQLPSGRLIRYPKLRMEEGGTWPDGRSKRSWVYGEGRHKAFISGPKIVENVVQALARDVLADNTLEMFRQTRLRPKLSVHDELVYIVPESEATDALATLQGVMRTPPKWWPELVTWSEGSTADTYGHAK